MSFGARLDLFHLFSRLVIDFKDPGLDSFDQPFLRTLRRPTFVQMSPSPLLFCGNLCKCAFQSSPQTSELPARLWPRGEFTLKFPSAQPLQLSFVSILLPIAFFPFSTFHFIIVAQVRPKALDLDPLYQFLKFLRLTRRRPFPPFSASPFLLSVTSSPPLFMPETA